MRTLCLFLAGGCWVTEPQVQARIDTLADTDSGDTGEEPGPLSFTALSPAFGSNAGGYEVALTVEGAGSDVEVTFAGANAAVLRVEGTEVVVRAPTVGVVGAVDVKVESGDRETTLERSFTYWKDGSGKAGLLGYVANYDFDRPYLDEPGISREAEVFFVDPIAYDYLSEFAPGVDDCKRDYVRPGSAPARFRPALDKVTVRAGASDIDLTFDEREDSFLFVQDGAWFTPASDVGLAVGAAPGWGSFEVKPATVMPDAGFRMTVPDTDASPAYVNPSFDLQWTGGRPGDAVVVLMNRYGLQDEVVDQVTCVLKDDGSFRIPDLWSDWLPFQQIDVYLGRVKRGTGVLPYNGASVGVVGIHWWYGAVYTDF